MPPGLLVIGGLASRSDKSDDDRPFLLGWLAASVVGVALVPNFFQHYALPLLLPASIIASRLMLRQRVWQVFAWALPLLALLTGPAFARAKRD